MVITMVEGARCFPLAWTDNLVMVIVYDFDYLTPDEKKVI